MAKKQPQLGAEYSEMKHKRHFARSLENGLSFDRALTNIIPVNHQPLSVRHDTWSNNNFGRVMFRKKIDVAQWPNASIRLCLEHDESYQENNLIDGKIVRHKIIYRLLMLVVYSHFVMRLTKLAQFSFKIGFMMLCLCYPKADCIQIQGERLNWKKFLFQHKLHFTCINACSFPEKYSWQIYSWQVLMTSINACIAILTSIPSKRNVNQRRLFGTVHDHLRVIHSLECSNCCIGRRRWTYP